MKSETTNITINMQIWFQIVFESRNLFILSEELQIFFHMKSETTNIALNKQKWVWKFFDLEYNHLVK